MEKIEKKDARKLTPRELSQMRKLVIKLRKKGMLNKEVTQLIGLATQTTSKYYTRYENFFKVKNAGRPKNVGKRLSDSEEAKIIKLLIDKNPQQLKLIDL